jgi:leucyl aminopeptidase (aminopeptidase T)
VHTCLNIKAGEGVWIQTWDHSLSLAAEIALACKQRGAFPTITVVTEEYWIRSLIETPKKLLETFPSSQSALMSNTNAFLFMLGPKNPVDWSKIPEEKQELADVWYLSSNKYVDQWRKVVKEHSVRVLGVEYPLATHERAQALGLDLEEWRETMLAGCLANQTEVSMNCERFSKRIHKGHKVNIQTPFGTCLDFELTGREVIIGDSIVTAEDARRGIVKFLPSGFVEVAPDENSVEGTVVFDVPVVVGGRKRIECLRLEFKKGKVIEYHAKNGVEVFESYLSGQGDVDKFAFFGLGLNPGLKHGFTQDDKVLGGITIGIGGNEDKGGKNRTNGNSTWWASTTRGTLKIDGSFLLKSGHFV